MDSKRTKTSFMAEIPDAFIIACFVVYAYSVMSAPYRYLSDDAMSYFQIAESFANGKGLVFGAEIPTNGFHPFWLITLSILSGISSSQNGFITMIAGITILLNAGTLALVRYGLCYWISPFAISISLLVSMPFFLFAGYGMESALACFFMVISIVSAMYFLETFSKSSLIACFICTGLAVFARLDLAIVLAPLIIYVLTIVVKKWHQMPRIVLFFPPAMVMGAIPVLAWLIFNSMVFYDPVPISGRLKMSSGGGGGLGSSISGMIYVYSVLLLISSTLLLFAKRKLAQVVVMLSGFGEICYLMYLQLSGQGEIYAWYFVGLSLLSGVTTAATLDAFIYFDRPARSFSWINGKKIYGGAILMSLSVLLGLGAIYKISQYRAMEGFNILNHKGVNSLGVVAKREGVNRVLVFDRPGQLAYLDGLDVIAVDGLTTNRKFQQLLHDNGIGWLLDTYNINAFIGPTESKLWLPGLCSGNKYLAAMRFVCGSDGLFQEVKLYSRLDGKEIGTIDLKDARRVAYEPRRELALYLLPPRGKHINGAPAQYKN